MTRYDLAVLGGGTAGLVSSLIAAGAGARVALVESERTGGDCLWTGCVPSKSLLAAAELAQRIREGARLGVGGGKPEIDFERVMAHVDRARATLAPHDSPARLRREGVDVIESAGRFRGPGELEADGRVLGHRAAVVATGSVPALPPIAGLEQAEPLTSDTVWRLRELPRRLAVLGGGPVGCELGQAFARLGSAVTLVEAEERLLPREEPRAGALVAERLGAEGVEVQTRARAREVRASPGGAGVLALDPPTGGAPRELEFDRLLVAAGRRPVSAGIGLEALGIETSASGAIPVDRLLRTGAPGVFAAGDVTGVLPFTHVAAYHARVASINALFRARRKVDYRAVPWVTFTDPEVARVGLSEAQARRRWGERARAVEFDYARLDRAVTADRALGFAKLVGDRRGRLVGATVAAPAAGESIAELAAWI
ncbi:MAG: dihydrolipoyl dehydrogenase family protein, partial [Thermoleophilaceae bacterium]